MKNIKDVLHNKEFKKNPRIAYEFQDYGYRLAERLGDTKHTSLYISLAKKIPRNILENAYRFTIDYSNIKRSKARVFMWRLKQLRGFEYIKKGKTQRAKLNMRKSIKCE